MNRITSVLSIALCAVASFNAIANTISGEVKDEGGRALSQGFVQIMGTNKRTPINEQGRFIFTNVKAGTVELHVASINHIHSSEKVQVVANQTVMVNIRVDNASIEIFDVNASAFHASNIESAAPVSILAGEKLKQQQASTLGETLKNLAGVHSTYYGGVTSSPIIRGLDGPRVLITQNGMDAADASRVGPDHLVSTESSTVQQIEVLRGPATLFYGSGAIGGVVNMVDTRIPNDNLNEGQLAVSRNSNNAEQAFSGEYKTGFDNIAFQVLGFYRDSDDYRIPGFAESAQVHEDHEHSENSFDEDGVVGVVKNTAARTKGITLGTSYLFDSGHVGFSVEHLSSVYGIPGHAHGGHEDEHHEDETDDDHLEQATGQVEIDATVQANLQQNRYQLAGEFQLSTAMVSAINFGIAYTDYQHTELENAVPGTRFSNELFETRIEVLHQPIDGWRGGLSLHTKMSDFAAVGAEAFTPPSDTKSFGLGVIEEKHFGDFLVQLGARIEKVTINVPQVFTPTLDLHEESLSGEHINATLHEQIEIHAADADHAADANHSGNTNHAANSSALPSADLSFTPVSLSAGVVWDVAKGYNLAASFVHANRAPSSAELFSFGPHIGTQSYEIGALYTLHDGEYEFDIDNPKMEISNNIDLSWRKFGGQFGVVFNLFYNQIDNYYYAANTGAIAKADHEHDVVHDESNINASNNASDHEAHESEGLPIYAYVAASADLYGAELQLTYNLTSNLSFMAQGDYIRAKVKQSETGNLPRIPPIKTILSVDYKTNDLSLTAQLTHMFSQSKLAELESQTKAYTLVDINASFFTSIWNTNSEIFIRARNLLDENARVHTSFLKDLAPLQGRSLELGLRLNF